jgi:hypothetical protein
VQGLKLVGPHEARQQRNRLGNSRRFRSGWLRAHRAAFALCRDVRERPTRGIRDNHGIGAGLNRPRWGKASGTYDTGSRNAERLPLFCRRLLHAGVSRARKSYLP